MERKPESAWLDAAGWGRSRPRLRPWLVSAAAQRLSRRDSRGLLIATPLAAIVIAAGFAAQGLTRRPGGAAQDQLLDVMLAAPAPPRDTTVEAEQLRRVQSQRIGPSAPPEAASGSALDLEIRVALLQCGPDPLLSAAGPWRLVGGDGRLLLQGQPGEGFRASDALRAQGEAWLQSGSGAVLVDSQPYPGRLRLLAEGQGVRVINHVPLETYISSVVGAEMPSSWSMEALRAQAVAARSYALAQMARPANRHWHLGDTTRWQAYRGLRSVVDRTLRAARSTNGLIMSYQGAIVESLYAANRQISLEAHGHLGASMSQQEAQQMAVQGFRYHQILGRFYPGASLARLRAGAG